MLSTSELADLGMWLRDRGFAVTSTQLIAAARVVNGSRQFASREALVPYLAPLFCSDARMQKRFAQEYGVWLGLMGLASVPVTMQDVATHTTHSLVPAPGEALPKRLAFLNGLQARHWLRAHMRVRWWVMAVFAFSFFALIVALLWRKNEELAIKPTPASASIAVVASGAAKTPVTTPQALQASLPTKLDPAAVVPETKPAPPQLDKPEPSLLTNPFFLATLAVILAWFFHLWATCWLIDDFSLFHSTLITTALFVLSRLFGNYLIITLVLWALLWWVTAKRRRHAFLRRLPADTPKVATLRLAIANKPLNHLSRQIKLLGPALRQRRYTHTREIDVAASIQATVRLGGIAAPVFGSKQEPEYLLLVDRASHHDHFAELADALLGALQAQGVWLACYQFSGDLQEMHPYPVSDDILHDGLQTLAQLAKRHGDARLIIFSDGAWLIDRCTGDVHDKVAQLHAWPRPLLLTPNARRTWAVREWLLAHAGLQILPMDEDGLAVLRHLYEARGVTPAVVDEAQQQLGPMFLHNQDLWLDRVAPPKAEVAALVQALKDDLGKAGFVWLAACAVYPEIHWGITLAIGESLHHQSGVRQDWQLAGRNQHADCLLQLARLPWLRHGFMPGWFRQALLAEIPAGAHELVKCELAILLQGLKQAQSGSTNDLQVHIQSTQGGRWRQIWQRWLSLRVPEAAQDKVFLSFMGSNAFTLQPAGMLRRWLYPQGLLLAGPRSGLVLLGLCLTAGLLLTIKEPVSNEGALASASTPAIIATVPQASAPEPSITQPVSVLSTVASGVATSADATASATPAPKPGTAAASLPASSTITGANAALVAQATPSPSAITNDVPGKIDVDSSAPSAAAILSCDIC
ncbi:MAG: hypothetical protein RL748_2368, partial [Pseudomonadota bacterium]